MTREKIVLESPDAAFDSNKFAAEVVIQGVEAAANHVANSSAVAKLRRLYQRLTNAYGPYLEKTYQRVSTIRTFLRPSESIDLLSAYVPVDLELSDERVAVDDLIARIHADSSFVINGLAGRGKSVLMRFLAISMYHSPQGKLPLFIELRNLNSLTTKELLPYIHAQYNSDGGIDYSDFLSALQSGYFVIILDGFDEISPADRDTIERQILQINSRYPRCPLVVSGRHDDRFHSWERFTVLNLLPMSLKQTRSLIEKAQYSEEVKRNFLKRLTDDFFEKHESFLNTPLLAIMLMRTFEEYAEIPQSLHEFYRSAFDTLIRRHDAMKSQFLRITHSGCSAEEFKRVFSSFCVLTYSKSAFSFNRDEALQYLQSAMRQQGIESDPELLLRDLIESICLLHEEGLEISFVHRSFQEYFCALFVSMSPTGLVERYLETANLRIHDDVLPMLMGINPERVEDEWAASFVEDILKKYPKSNRNRHLRIIIDRFPKWRAIAGHQHCFVTVLDPTKLDRCIRIIQQFYPEHFKVSSPDSAEYTHEKYLEHQKRQFDLLSELEESGVQSLAGYKDFYHKQLSSNRSKHFPFEVDERFEPFFKEIYRHSFDSILRGFDAVQKTQRGRKRQGDRFIEEIFGA